MGGSIHLPLHEAQLLWLYLLQRLLVPLRCRPRLHFPAGCAQTYGCPHGTEGSGGGTVVVQAADGPALRGLNGCGPGPSAHLKSRGLQ